MRVKIAAPALLAMGLALAACEAKAPEPAAPAAAPASAAEPAAAPAAATPAPADATAPAPAPAADATAPAAAPAPAAAAAAPAGPPTLASLAAPYNAADLDNGKTVFNKCRNCHSLKEADGNLIGPNLHGVFTRHPGTAPKFKYSEAMGKVTLERWTPEEVDKWLTNPKDYLPGSAMFLDGIKKPDDRRDVIAWLMTQS
jgi:cytochrome c